jgi:hypothetical protein
LLAFLHEPGGQPFRSDNGRAGGFGEEAAVYDVDGRDVLAGYYEAVAVAPPEGPVSAEMRIERSPVALWAARSHRDTVTAKISARTAGNTAGTTMFGLVGAERSVPFSQTGGTERRVGFRIPAWAKRLVVRAQWTRFTDLGLTILDADGQVLNAAPLN